MPKISEYLELSFEQEKPQLRRTLVTQKGMIPNVEGAVGEVIAASRKFDTAAAAAALALERTDIGKEGAHTKKLERGRELKAALTTWKTKNDLSERIKRARTKLYEPEHATTDPTQALVQEQRRAEIRRYWEHYDPTVRDAAYLGLSDAETLDALENAPQTLWRARPEDTPRLVPFITPALVERRRAERAAAANPELAAELAELEIISRLYRSTVAAAEHALFAEVPELRNEGETVPADEGR